MKRWVWIAMVFWLLSPVICSAGWYKYKDKNGVWHYTDSMTAEVPPEKRVEVQKYKEPDDYLTDEQRKAKRLREGTTKADQDTAAAEKAKQEKISSQYKDLESYELLEKKRAELAELYKEMMVRKRELEAQQEKIDSGEAYKEHQALMAEYNASAVEYKARRQAYEQAVKAFEAKTKGQGAQ